MQNTFTKETEEKANEFSNETQKRLQQGLKQGEEQLRKVINTVDKQLHENPWPVVGGVALSCLLLGFLMGQRKGG
jgi:ElaB/YqjD/DUF883 family membrane-anchored ribosome-binding protein